MQSIPARALTFFVLALPALAQYAGPAILSRGEGPAGLAPPQLSFRPYVEVTGIYSSGLAGVVTGNSEGRLANASAKGVQLAGGISGAHGWRHTRIGLDYQGSVRHYSRKTFYDGVNQSLMLGVSHQFTRHITLSLRESAGVFSRSFGLLGLPQTSGFDPSSSYIPTTDFFDNRTIYASTQADLTYQKSQRLSFNLGGDGFLARRRSTALYGVTGGAARGDVQYRLSRRTTVGINYGYTHFDFTRVFSGTDMHHVVLTYAVRLTRNLEFSALAGGIRAESKFLQSVPVDPKITELLGITSGVQVAHPIRYMPNVEARLSRSFQHGVAYVHGGQSVTPGNGLFLTSRAITTGGGYSYTGLRRWSFNSNIQYNRSESITSITGNYRTTSGGFTASRQLAWSLHALASASARKYDSPQYTNYNRTVYEVRLGFGFSPGDVPLRIW
jgi:hypothetical protein